MDKSFNDSFSAPVLITLALCLGVSLAKVLEYRWSLHPGPKGLPFLGNLLQVPALPWLRYDAWKAEFGPIFSLNMAGQRVIVLNTHEVATELLERRSKLYSDRPRMILASEILCGGLAIGFCGYGDQFKKLRKAATEGFHKGTVGAYRPMQERDAILLVDGLLNEPEAWDDHCKRTAASIMLTTVYGMEPVELKDTLVIRINSIMTRMLQAVLPGASIVDLFPLLDYLPHFLAPWRQKGSRQHELDTSFFQERMDEVKGSTDAGKAKDSFASTLMERNDKHDLSYKEQSWLAGMMFGPGSDTTAATLSFFFLAMRLYPDVMRRAQAEIDTCIGPDRMPTFDDLDGLPYLHALVKELLRWRPVVPLGLPRRAMEDDNYNGHIIPKGSMVLMNIWAMNRDPTLYPDYDQFRPERFLDETDTIDSNTRGQGHVSFGFGRRVCVGMHMANQSLLISIASVLWAVSIGPEKDESGKEIVPSAMDFVDEGVVVRPAHFRCKIVPRRDNVEAIVQKCKTEYGI